MRLLIGPNGWTKSPKCCCTGPREERCTEGGEGASWFEGGLPPLSLPCSLFWSPHLCLVYPSPSPDSTETAELQALAKPCHPDSSRPTSPSGTATTQAPCLCFLSEKMHPRPNVHVDGFILNSMSLDAVKLPKETESIKANRILRLLGCSLYRI